jgi:hypothetical protein
MGKYSQMLSNRMRVNRQVTPFHKVPADQVMGDISQCTSANAVEYYEYYKTKEHWLNDKYYVILDKDCNDSRFVATHFLGYPLWNMRIHRIDLEKIHDWCVLQEIKNKIIGEEFEALELYPARSRHMDEGNRYHLWILSPQKGETRPPKIPIGHLRKNTLMILQQTYEQMDSGRRQELNTKYSDVIIFPHETFPVAKAMFSEDSDSAAMIKYAKSHAEMFYR